MSNQLTVIDPKIDEVRVFMLYTLFGGDCARVAVATRLEVSRIEALAHDFNWKGKLLGRGLGTEKGQEDERALNRVTNYVTVERLKRVFGSLIDHLDTDPDFAKQFCTSVDADTGKTTFQTKNLVELAKGLEICNNISYRALQDKQAQAADVVGGPTDAAALALATDKALAGRFDRATVVDATAEIVNATQDARHESNEQATR
jgi:hypothetical protein